MSTPLFNYGTPLSFYRPLGNFFEQFQMWFNSYLQPSFILYTKSCTDIYDRRNVFMERFDMKIPFFIHYMYCTWYLSISKMNFRFKQLNALKIFEKSFINKRNYMLHLHSLDWLYHVIAQLIDCLIVIIYWVKKYKEIDLRNQSKDTAGKLVNNDNRPFHEESTGIPVIPWPS